MLNNSLYKSTIYKFYPLFSSDEDLLKKSREVMNGLPSIVFTKAVANKRFIRESIVLCKIIVGYDANEVCLQFVRQDMPTGLYTRWSYNEETQKLRARQNRVRTCENMVLSFFQATRPECKTQISYTTRAQRKLIASVLMVFATIISLFWSKEKIFPFCPCQKTRDSLTDDDINRGTKKK